MGCDSLTFTSEKPPKVKLQQKPKNQKKHNKKNSRFIRVPMGSLNDYINEFLKSNKDVQEEFLFQEYYQGRG
jgi:hypothetical protein